MAKVEVKQPIVDKIAEEIKDAQSVVLVDYRGLTVAQDAPALELKGGVVEGTAYDVAGISELAKIPSRDELLSKLLGSLQSPITNFARVIKQIAEQGGEAAPAEAAEETATDAE